MSDMNVVAPEVQNIVDELFANAHEAAASFSSFEKDRVEAIVKVVAEAAQDKAEFYAEWAVRETGFGNVADKHQKNLLNSIGLLEVLNVGDYVDSKVDYDKKIVSFPKPAGVVVALVPCTNPVTTIYYKAIISLMTRNSVILCPHPAAKECCVHAAEYITKIAESAGAPEGAIQVLKEPKDYCYCPRLTLQKKCWRQLKRVMFYFWDLEVFTPA